jgi:cyclopropane-fatty-acyl-phospholipid synthase
MTRWFCSVLHRTRLHYAQTLAHGTNGPMRRAEIEELYNERFFRMWQFYLAGAIATFHHDGNCNFQLQLARRRDAVPLTRDYIGIAESRLSDRFETAGRKEQPDLSSLSADCYSPNG